MLLPGLLPVLAPAAFPIFLMAAPLGAPGPTVAVEDTMHTQVPEVLVRAPRVTLAEILDRVARGEARRDSMIHDQSFLSTARVVGHVLDENQKPVLIAETVARVYKKRPNKLRTVVLRHYSIDENKKKKKPGVTVGFGPGMDEEVVNFAFRPEGRRQYKFRIAGRDLVGDHLIYRIAYEPKSLIDPGLPIGLVWVDTNDFVIVRQEANFARSPMPLILKGVDRLVVERQHTAGLWVLKRVLMRAELAFSFPKIGRSFDLSLQYDDYTMNSGLPDSLFGGPTEEEVEEGLR